LGLFLIISSQEAKPFLHVRTIFIEYENTIFSALLCQNSLPQQISKNKTVVERFGELGHYFLQLQIDRSFIKNYNPCFYSKKLNLKRFYI
jgi:hypothetical protein